MLFVILLILIVEDNHIGSRNALMYGKPKSTDNDPPILLGFMDTHTHTHKIVVLHSHWDHKFLKIIKF